MSEIGIGIVGSGYMALTYAAALNGHVQGARLRAVALGRRAPALAADYGVDAAPSLGALLARPDIDAVILATPDQLHCEQALQAAAAGKHVLAEKPMAPTVAQCDAMIAACRAAGVQLAVVKTERYRQVTRRAKALIEQGAIGPIRMLRTISCFPEPLGIELLTSRPWYTDPAGGGLFMSMASHNADMLLWLSGLRARRVFAQAQTYGASGAPAQSVLAQISFEQGVIGDMLISAEMPPPSLPSSEVRFQVIGGQGMLDFENYEFLDMGAGERWQRVLTPERFDYLRDPTSPIRLAPHAGVLQGFVDAVREARPPDVPGEAGRAAVALCAACLESAATGLPIDLPLEAG